MELTKIKEIRKLRKMNIGRLSDKTGINRNRISLIERGKVNPSYETVVKIVNALEAKIVFVI